jgi:hypothetical protein
VVAVVIDSKRMAAAMPFIGTHSSTFPLPEAGTMERVVSGHKRRQKCPRGGKGDLGLALKWRGKKDYRFRLPPRTQFQP